MSFLSDALGFLGRFGFFDVLLPFLLIYVMVFAILERTRIFGTEDAGKTKAPRSNLNALFAFSIALIAVVSSRVVSTLNSAIGPIMILLVLVVLFLMIVSVFKKDDGIS